jgi:hypothetical protein
MDMPQAPDENYFEGCKGWFVKMFTFAPLMITSSVALKNPLDASASGRVFLCFVISLLLKNGKMDTTYWKSRDLCGVGRFCIGK